MKKRALAILLALAMMVTFMPAMAFADEPAPQGQPQTLEEYAAAAAIANQKLVVKAISDYLTQYSGQVRYIQKLENDFHDKFNKGVNAYLATVEDPEKLEAAIKAYAAAVRSIPAPPQNFEELKALIGSDPNVQAALADLTAKYNELNEEVYKLTSLHFEEMTPENVSALIESGLFELNSEIGKKLEEYDAAVAKFVRDCLSAVSHDPRVVEAWDAVQVKYNELNEAVALLTGLHFEEMTPDQIEAKLKELNGYLMEKTAEYDAEVAKFVREFIADQQAGFEKFMDAVKADPALNAAFNQLKAVYGMLNDGFETVTNLRFEDLNEERLQKILDDLDAEIAKAVAKFNEAGEAALREFIDEQANNLKYFLDNADKWIADYAQAMNDLAKAKTMEAYQKAMDRCELAYYQALDLAEQLYDIGLTQKAIIEQLYAEGGTEAVYQGIRDQLDELEAMYAEAQEKMATILTNQFQALKNQSAFVKSEITKFLDITGIGAHINNVVDIVSDMVEQMTLVAAEYQAVIGQMNSEVKAALQEQFNEVLSKYNKVVEQFQTFARQLEKVVDAAKLGDVEALLDLLDLAAEDFGIDMDALIEKCVDDLIALMESEEVQKVIQEITDLVTRIENTALDIYAYGTALASGEETPYTSALLDSMMLEFENGELKEEIESLESDIRDLQAVNKSLIINNNNLTEENKTLKEENKKDDKAYQTLVSNVKNSRKVVKNKVVLKQKATKNVKTRKIVIKWKKWTTSKGKITKYQVYYKAKGKSAVKKYVKKSKTKYTTKKLKKGTTYTVKVRAVYKLPYKNASGETKYLTYYSKWSKAKKVTINK